MATASAADPFDCGFGLSQIVSPLIIGVFAAKCSVVCLFGMRACAFLLIWGLFEGLGEWVARWGWGLGGSWRTRIQRDLL